MLEDPARDERVGEGGDAVAAAAARGAAQHVHREGPLEEFGPALALWFGAGLSFGLGLADAWPGGGDGAAGDDGIAQGRGGGEDAEVGPLVLARVGDQGDEGGVVRDSCYDSVLSPTAARRSSSLPSGLRLLERYRDGVREVGGALAVDAVAVPELEVPGGEEGGGDQAGGGGHGAEVDGEGGRARGAGVHQLAGAPPSSTAVSRLPRSCGA